LCTPAAGDPKLIPAAYCRDPDSPYCKTCANFAGAAVRLQKDETHLAEDAILVRSAEAAPVEAGRSLVDVYADFPITREVDGRGHLVRTSQPQPRHHFTVVVQNVHGGWITRAVIDAA